jgi:hypothetical protein
VRQLASKVAPLVLVFAVGLAVGWVAKDSRRGSQPVAQFRGPIELRQVAPLGPPAIDLAPYRVVIDGRAAEVAEPPHGSSEAWRIDLDGGRVVIFAAAR